MFHSASILRIGILKVLNRTNFIIIMNTIIVNTIIMSWNEELEIKEY